MGPGRYSLHRTSPPGVMVAEMGLPLGAVQAFGPGMAAHRSPPLSKELVQLSTALSSLTATNRRQCCPASPQQTVASAVNPHHGQACTTLARPHTTLICHSSTLSRPTPQGASTTAHSTSQTHLGSGRSLR